MDAISQHDLAWDDVKVLLALSRTGTFKGAADQLGVAGSTIGRRLDALEAALGTRLYDRTPDGVQPTAAAERLVPWAEQVEVATASLLRAVESFESKPEGVVKLTAPPGVADAFLVPRLPELFRRYPGLRLELEASVAYADLSRREADLALRTMRPTAGDLVSVKIAEVPDVLFAAPSLVKRWGALKSFEGVPFVTQGDGLAQIPAARWLRAAAKGAVFVLKTDSASALLKAAESGVGAVVLPEPYAAVTKLARVKLAPALEKAMPPPAIEHLHLVGHRAMRHVPRIAAVWDFLLEGFSGARAAGPGSTPSSPPPARRRPPSP